jgi:two-component system, LytTR family, sensor kinase
VRPVEHLNEKKAGAMTESGEGIRYPGIGWMLLFWSVIGALTVARYQLPIGKPGASRESLQSLIACASWYLPWGILSPMVFRLERRYPLGSARWMRHLACIAAISVPFCMAAAPVMMAIFEVFRNALAVSRNPMGRITGVGYWFATFPSAQGMFWVSVGAGYFVRTLSLLHQHEQRATRLALEKSQLESSLNQAQLEALRARLNPHFLFNSLQNISVLTKQDPHTASRMLTVLGDLLRAVLRSDSQPETSLSEEIDLTRSYVALEQMRFGDRLRVTFDIADGVQQALVPSFLMQPLLENAIIHGLRGVRKTGIIAVRAAAEQNGLAITVTDNGMGPPADASQMKIGVGLGSTCERLTRMYPGQHGFSISRPQEGGAEVRITLPLRFVNSAPDARAHEKIPALNR